MQHRQYQTINGQFQPFHTHFCLLEKRGTIWVANFVFSSRFKVFPESQKLKINPLIVLYSSIFSYFCTLVSA